MYVFICLVARINHVFSEIQVFKCFLANDAGRFAQELGAKRLVLYIIIIYTSNVYIRICILYIMIIYYTRNVYIRRCIIIMYTSNVHIKGAITHTPCTWSV